MLIPVISIQDFDFFFRLQTPQLFIKCNVKVLNV